MNRDDKWLASERARLISDGQQEVTRVKNQAIHQPWRR